MARLAILTISHKSTRKAAEKPDIQKGPPDFSKANQRIRKGTSIDLSVLSVLAGFNL
jgi:hypothetical protein